MLALRSWLFVPSFQQPLIIQASLASSIHVSSGKEFFFFGDWRPATGNTTRAQDFLCASQSKLERENGPADDSWNRFMFMFLFLVKITLLCRTN
jgi:hypothetical protein